MVAPEKLWAPLLHPHLAFLNANRRRISDAVADTAPAVREVMKSLAGFKNTGKRMLAAWSEGVSVLRDSRMYGLSQWKSAAAFEGISDPLKLKKPRTVIGRSELLAHRTKSKSK